MRKAVAISPCRRFRYALWREWDEALSRLAFIGLNPSTADGEFDDPTIRRCLGFARSWGFGSLAMLNLFALRSTDPGVLQTTEDPVGPDNDLWIESEAGLATMVIAAWGVRGSHLQRASEILPRLSDVHVLGLTKGGQPRHPLYVPGAQRPFPLAT